MTDNRAKRLAELIEPLRVTPGSKVTLPKDLRPGVQGRVAQEEGGRGASATERAAARRVPGPARRAGHVRRPDRAAGARRRGQGRDHSSRHERRKPSGRRRSQLQSALDRGARPRLPVALRSAAAGARTIGIFNRSHYEEVLVVRVHPHMLEAQNLPRPPKGGDLWKRRYREINDWERYLVDNGFRIVKLFLNISREEQRRRFLKRIDLPEKNWKFSASDVHERAHWDEYQRAYSETLTHTSTDWAPWHVIPADHEWFARLAAGAVIAHTLIDIDPKYPLVDPEAKRTLRQDRTQLEAEAPAGAAPDPFKQEQSRTG